TLVNGAALKLLTTLANNSTTTYTDAIPDASLGAAPPATGTAVLAQAVVGGILTGTAGLVTARKVYRTKVNGSALFLLTTIANNSATAIAADSTPDTSLVTAGATSTRSGPAAGSGGRGAEERTRGPGDRGRDGNSRREYGALRAGGLGGSRHPAHSVPWRQRDGAH